MPAESARQQPVAAGHADRLDRLPAGGVDRPSREVRRRRLSFAAVASVLLHAAVLAGSIGFLRGGAPADTKPDKRAMVELLMVEQKGAGPPSPGSPAPAPSEAQAQAAVAAPQPAPSPADPTPAAESQPVPAPASQKPPPAAAPVAPQAETPVAPGTEAQVASSAMAPAETPVPSKAQAKAPSRPETPTPPKREAPAAPPAKAPLEFNLAGTDSQSNAIAEGADIIPASVDQRVRNRPPIYPQEAARLGQQGTVVLLIHVSRTGRAAGSDVLQSSGVASLDRSAQDAVAAWRFLPAVKDGAPVPFDMPMRFVFEFN